jgi:hypothetical protein
MAENRRESDDSVIDVEAADFKERCAREGKGARGPAPALHRFVAQVF